jgi:hypothetical protein
VTCAALVKEDYRIYAIATTERGVEIETDNVMETHNDL